MKNRGFPYLAEQLLRNRLRIEELPYQGGLFYRGATLFFAPNPRTALNREAGKTR